MNKERARGSWNSIFKPLEDLRTIFCPSCHKRMISHESGCRIANASSPSDFQPAVHYVCPNPKCRFYRSVFTFGRRSLINGIWRREMKKEMAVRLERWKNDGTDKMKWYDGT
jgi:hypothetical protein